MLFVSRLILGGIALKKRLLSIILVTVLLIVNISDVFAAVIVTTSPYSGDYLLSINTSTDETTTQYSGNLSTDTTGLNSTQLSIDTTGTTNSDVADIKVENGQTLYQVDPRNKLPKMKAPVTSTINAQYNTLAYQVKYSVGDVMEFVTYNFSLKKYELKYFTLQYSGSKCNIWLEEGSAVNLNSTNISSIGNEFDNNISPNMTTNFGDSFDRDGDGKTTIMLYDIQDGFVYKTNNRYIGGFFDPNDLVGYNNNMDVLHIDTYPSMGLDKTNPNVTGVYGTMVHENQHLINFSYSYIQNIDEMPIWLNEGLSMAAENMFYGALTSRINYYNNSTYIRDGHSLFYWDNNGDVLSNYALSYLFVQYLRTQTKSYADGGTATYKWLIQNHNGTSTVVQDMMRQFYPTITLDDIQINFRMAIVLKEPTGAQGFMGESAFDSIVPQLYTGSGTNLRGGGAVIKAISSPVTPSGYGANIKFVGFKWDKVATPTSSVVSGTVAISTQVALSCSTTGAIIRYTTNGSTPTSYNGWTYDNNYPITITENTTVKSMAYKSKMSSSDVATFTYNIKVAAPIVSLATGTQVTLSCITGGSAIRYTSDGTTPTSTMGIIYTTPITINTTTTLKIIAYKSGMIDSDVVIYDVLIVPAKPLSINSYGIYSGTQELNTFPQLAGKYTINAQYTNATGKSITNSFILTVNSDKKLLKTYFIPKTIAINGVVDISQDIDLPSAISTPNLIIKLMAFDSLLNLAPLSNLITLER